jgi:hypothetical protein
MEILADRVRDTTTGTGVGPFLVTGTPQIRYRTFNQVLSSGDTFPGLVLNNAANEWIVGELQYTATNTIAIVTVDDGSNGIGNPVSFSIGTKEIILVANAEWLQRGRNTLTVYLSNVTQAVIDGLPDGTIVTVLNGGTIHSLTITNRNLHFVLAPGTINISGTILLDTCQGVTFLGDGMCNAGGNGTTLSWTGNNIAIPVFKLQHCQHCAFKFFNIVISQFNKANAAFWTMSTTGGLVPTECIWEEIIVEGVDGIGMNYGFRLGVPGLSVGDNNEFHQFNRVGVNNYKIAAFSIEQAESKSNSFNDCGFSGNSVGEFGVVTALNGGVGGSFIWRGGGGGGNTIADFYLGQVDDFISIKDFNTEGSARLLESDAAASAPWTVTLENGRFAGNNLNADGHAIYFRNRGPLIVNNVSFENVGAVTALDLFIETTGPARGICIAIGCSIGTTLANPLVTSNSSNARWYNFGSVISASGSDAIPLPFTSAVVLDYSELTTSPNRGMLTIVDDANVSIPGMQVTSGGGSNSILAGAIDGSGKFYSIAGVPSAPTVQTGATYTADSGGPSDTVIIFNHAGTATLTLPTASAFLARRIRVVTRTANTVVSASSNVAQRATGSVSTAILAAAAGNWADLDSDGSNWVITGGTP